MTNNELWAEHQALKDYRLNLGAVLGGDKDRLRIDKALAKVQDMIFTLACNAKA